MSDNRPKISSLQPIVLPDHRRVTLEMEVIGLPTTFSNVMLMPDVWLGDSTPPQKPDPTAASPYPDIELSILNGRRQQLVSLYVVEHKETYTSLTLHLPVVDLQDQYTARAEMSYRDEIIDVVEVPFSLDQTR
jgi:hypothetical protein